MRAAGRFDDARRRINLPCMDHCEPLDMELRK